ncbi:MAG TPA: hypothetical protein VK166_18495 [Chitinophagaceae bacterium]|nr:hypothetical protein [Chitinophagaceae bacterium]
MKSFTAYSKWVTLAAAILMIIICFMPWAYYPDLKKSFTGFFTENNIYGKPGKLLIFFALFNVLAQFSKSVFLKRANLLLMALNLAYAIKSYIVFAECYKGYCPEKQAGIYLMVVVAGILLMTAVLPSGTIKEIEK